METSTDWLALLQTQTDKHGQCDRCLCFSPYIWELDPEDPAGWVYCRKCIKQIAKRLKTDHAADVLEEVRS